MFIPWCKYHAVFWPLAVGEEPCCWWHVANTAQCPCIKSCLYKLVAIIWRWLCLCENSDINNPALHNSRQTLQTFRIIWLQAIGEFCFLCFGYIVHILNDYQAPRISIGSPVFSPKEGDIFLTVPSSYYPAILSKSVMFWINIYTQKSGRQRRRRNDLLIVGWHHSVFFFF